MRFYSKHSSKNNKQYWNDLPCICKIVSKRRLNFMEMSMMYIYRSDQNILGLNLLLRNKHQADINEIMQFETLVSSFAVFAAL